MSEVAAPAAVSSNSGASDEGRLFLNVDGALGRAANIPLDWLRIDLGLGAAYAQRRQLPPDRPAGSRGLDFPPVWRDPVNSSRLSAEAYPPTTRFGP